MICPNCKAENKDDATHCSNCGEYIASTEQAENQAPAIDKSSRLEEIQARRNKKKRQQKRNKIILICLIAAIAIGLATFGIYWAKTNILDKNVTDDTIVVTGTPFVSETPTSTEAVTALPTEIPTIVPTEAPTVAPTVAPAETPAPTIAPSNNSSNNTNTTSNSGTATKSTTKKTSAQSGITGKANTSGKTSAKATVTPKSTTPAIPQGNPMTNQTVTGLGYVTVPSTGEPLICFSIGGTKYYAYVPSYNPLGTAKGTFKVDAVNTGAVYYGLPVYSLSNIQIQNTSSNGSYILPKSSSKLLTASDLKGLTKAQLTLARNEIFARHGRTFKSKEIQDYFNAQSWYKVNPNYNYTNDYLNLSSTEKTNAKFILAYENK